jgi:hypothetical protein
VNRRILGALAAAALASAPARGQGVDPRLDWRTIATPHFRVHFPRELDALGRRAAANAERAWSELAAELTPPRGSIDLVVGDNVDYTQGYALAFPTNRVVVYAQPPVDPFPPRFYDDWSRVVITHELTHVFHLNRSRGVWRLLQGVMGRSPVLFPNFYSPSWLKEGLAVYYESRITGSGRLAGTEHRLFARAAGAAGHVPRLDELSRSTSVFPGGLGTYAFGSLAFEHLAASRGAGRVRDFVERESGLLIPWRLDHAARRSFGISFSDAWTQWRDSVERALAPVARGERAGVAPWRELTREGWYALYPRWSDASRLLYAANDGRNATSAFRVDVDGRRTLVGRRNGVSPNVLLPDGRVLFAQLEYVDPYTVRSDLWVQDDTTHPPEFGAAARGQRRLTRGARLSQPDARADGEIVAVQGGAATSWLARVSPDGRRIVPLTRAIADTQWTEPRWSPDGRRVAAIAMTPGARSAVIVVDTAGRTVRVLAADRAVNAAPSWSSDGARVYWSSDRTGVPQLYVAEVEEGAGAPRRLSDVASGLLQPVAAPGGGSVAALLFRRDGYHVAIADVPALDAAGPLPDTSAIRPAPAAATALPVSTPAGPYRPWRTLVPRYWLPVAGPSDGNSLTVGASTSARDVIGRHSYDVQATVNVDTRDVEWSGAYRWSGLGQPVVDLAGSQSWTYDTVTFRVGTRTDTAALSRRARTASLTLDLLRPRFRTGASVAVGAFVERRSYASPAPALVQLAADRLGRNFPGLLAAASWSNTRRPSRSVSPEDGVALSATVQHRWQDGTLGPSSRRAVGSARLYKSLDLPGYAHHVLALRVAGGVADSKSATDFSAGGVSGTLIEVAPGIVIGDPTRTFGVRGFGSGAQSGLRAAAGSIEYRAPLTIPARGYRLLPLFVDRLSAAAFADAATAWCPAGIDRTVQTECARSLAVTPERPTWLASVGAELGVDAALDFDSPYRFRLGVAVPVQGRERAPRGASVYFTLGTLF